MDFKEAKDRLKRAYLDQDFALEKDTGKELVFTHEDYEHSFTLTKESIDAYAKVADSLGEFRLFPNEASISKSGYREQALARTAGYFGYFPGDETVTFGNPDSGEIYV